MICPKDNTQLKQYKGIGSGISDETYYDTMEIKYCPTCDSKFFEGYIAFELVEIIDQGNDSLMFEGQLLQFRENVRNLIEHGAG